jgi:hypothetical protein
MTVPRKDLPVARKGLAVPLLPSTLIDATHNTAGITGDWQTGLDQFSRATILLTVSAKNIDASTTADVWVQYSPNNGTTADDIAHFAQITNAAIANGTYVLYLNGGIGASAADRATTDAATLAAGQVRAVSWCDRVRVKVVAANIAGTDTITVKVGAYFQ